MIDRVRLSVDQETEALLKDVVDALTDALTARPEWTSDYQRESLEKLRALLVDKPAWATSLQAEIQGGIRVAVEQRLNLGLQDVKASQAESIGRLRSSAESLQRIESILDGQKSANNSILAQEQEMHSLLKEVARALAAASSSQLVSASERHKEVIEVLRSIASDEPPWASRLQSEALTVFREELRKGLNRVEQQATTSDDALRDQAQGFARKLALIETGLKNSLQLNERMFSQLEKLHECQAHQERMLTCMARPWWRRIFGGISHEQS